jgi:hypothetical protein
MDLAPNDPIVAAKRQAVLRAVSGRLRAAAARSPCRDPASRTPCTRSMPASNDVRIGRALSWP